MVLVLLLAGPSLPAATNAPAAAKAKTPAKPVLPPNPKKLLPPPGFPLAPELAAELRAGTDSLAREIEALRADLQTRPPLLALLPDVEILHRAVRNALEDDIFYTPGQAGVARSLLQQGQERARQLRQGQAPWNTATGLVVRGYVSRLDGSVQPYGLVVPPSYKPGT